MWGFDRKVSPEGLTGRRCQRQLPRGAAPDYRRAGRHVAPVARAKAVAGGSEAGGSTPERREPERRPSLARKRSGRLDSGPPGATPKAVANPGAKRWSRLKS